jgi:hypothetical protein
VRQLVDGSICQRPGCGFLGSAQERLTVAVGKGGGQAIDREQQYPVVGPQRKHGFVDPGAAEELTPGAGLSHG